MENKKLTVIQSTIVIIIFMMIITIGFFFYFTSSPLVKLTSQLPAEITIMNYQNHDNKTRKVILDTERQVYRLNIGENFLPLPNNYNWNNKIYYLFIKVDNIKEKCTLSKLSFVPGDIENRLISSISLENNKRTLIYKIHSSNHNNEYLITEDSNVKSSFSRASSNRTYRCNIQNGDINQLLQEFMTKFSLEHNNQ